MMAEVLSYPGHAQKLLEGLENMRKNRVACDFEIRVGEEIFPVHSTVLIACSTYFETLFSSRDEDDFIFKEIRDGYIVMKKFSVMAIHNCIEFVYTGKVQITFCNVKEILETSHLLELKGVVRICCQYLIDHLSLQSWFQTSRLLQLYGSQDDLSNADRYVARNYADVIQQTEFLEITEADFGRYMKYSNHSDEVNWQAIITWIHGDVAGREKCLPLLIVNLYKRWISVKFAINNILAHRLVQKSDEIKSVIFHSLSQNDATLEEELDSEMCLTLKDHIRNSKISDDIMNLDNILKNFLARELMHAFWKEKFFYLSLEDVTEILLVAQNHSSESVRWETILNWVRHEESRTNNLPELMKLLDFKKIPVEYILRNIRSEPMVAQSPTCIGILHESANFCVAPDTLVMLDSGTGILKTFDIETGYQSEITKFEKREFMSIISLRGNLYSLQDERLYKYSKTGNWEERATLLAQPCTSCQVVAFQDGIYVIEKNKMSRYDPSEDNWNEDLPGCGLNIGFCAAASENFIFCIGGTFGWYTAQRFNPESKKWSTIAALKDGRRGAAAATICDKLYVLGGFSPRTNKTRVECYDERTNQWSDVASMQRPRAWFTAIVHKECLYAVGGYPYRNTIEVYREDIDCWEEKGQMVQPEGDISLSVCTL